MFDSIQDVVGSILGLDFDELNAGQMAARALLTFAVTVAIIRFGDKRLFGKGTAFDIIVAIMIGSIMSRAITGSSPLFPTWVAGLVLVSLHWLIALGAFHLDWFGPLVKGNKVLLVMDGEIQWDGMRDGSVSRKDLDQAIRADGIAPDISKIERAYLERDGSISIIPHKKAPRIIDISVEDGVQTVRVQIE